MILEAPQPAANPEVFGHRLQRLRLERGLTLEEIGVETKISKRGLEALEAGAVPPRAVLVPFFGLSRHSGGGGGRHPERLRPRASLSRRPAASRRAALRRRDPDRDPNA